MLTLCVPVLRRYDLLQKMLLSAQAGTVVPERVAIINNGRDVPRLRTAVQGVGMKLGVLTPKEPMGVAESWNWFIDNVSEERLIANDDIIFGRESIERMVASKAELVWGSGFSCFILRDSCVEKLGRFDEDISPGYGYYEDDDYLQRLDGRGTREPLARAEDVKCGIVHDHSATLRAASYKERLEHDRRFTLAQNNYIKKWNIDREAFFGGAG